ncbi:hypothetical protein CQA38_07080 [Campylobacter sp. MIT 12-5580]|uniref:ankyrin repeat domain-containing protein n=1 Tax=Campylobacter sp. MIT 12-5580 TaxID=2040651 RepID=UPI0010F84D06|nr:ankyrin repeat domain-containing protein [Campylobacter sp. MIT 12-5580]TKX28635.1 hypothetical protein CQA38_07080 [Campylobacter sp. MIT 12-5580]
MRFLFFFLFCAVFAFNAYASCELLEQDKSLFQNANKRSAFDLNTTIIETLRTCEKSFKNQSFSKRLYELSNEIRGNNSSCGGIHYFAHLDSFHLLLAQLALDPSSYQTPSHLADKKGEFQAYFRYWAYQSIGNFRLYRAFNEELEKANKAFVDFFIKTHKMNAQDARIYAQKATDEFLFWAVGETKIFKDISEFQKLIIDKSKGLRQIQGYIYANKPSDIDLSIALQTALLSKRDTSIINELIQFGAKINEGYESALFYALESYENTQFLIQKGADVNASNAFGKTPLFYAVEFNQENIVKLLLEKGANVNARYINNNEKLAISGNTPYYITLCALEHTSKNVFMHAASYANVNILKLLTTYKVDINAKDDLGFNALDFAILAHKDENIAYLKTLGLEENTNLFYEGTLE